MKGHTELTLVKSCKFLIREYYVDDYGDNDEDDDD